MFSESQQKIHPIRRVVKNAFANFENILVFGTRILLSCIFWLLERTKFWTETTFVYHPSDQFGARVAHKNMAGKPVKVEDKAPKEKMILQMEQMNPAGILWDVMCSKNMFLYNLMPQLKKTMCGIKQKHQIASNLDWSPIYVSWTYHSCTCNSPHTMGQCSTAMGSDCMKRSRTIHSR